MLAIEEVPQPVLRAGDALVIGVPFMTAWLGLVTTAQIEAGETVLLGVDTLKLRAREIARIAEALRDGFDNGALRAPDVTGVPFARAVEAYTTLASKKLVLTFS